MERRGEERDRARESEFPDKASLKVQVTESLYISPHMHISDPFRLTLCDPPPPPPGVFIHGDRLGDVSHLSSRGVNALLVVFIAATRSEDEAQPWRDISKGSEIFEKKPHCCCDATRAWQLCVRASQAQYSSATLCPRVFLLGAL